jgi:CheY-like chemotaxis protein
MTNIGGDKMNSGSDAGTGTATAPVSEDRSVSPGQPLNILLVEDDEIDVENVRRAFRKNNIANPLWIAENGIEALQMLRSGTVPAPRRLILLDLNLPRMNGLEFLQALRSDPALAPLPVVVLTTSNDERDKVDAFNLNVAGYLLKPMTFTAFSELMGVLNKYWTLVELP